jgi:predicted ester cyclase
MNRNRNLHVPGLVIVLACALAGGCAPCEEPSTAGAEIAAAVESNKQVVRRFVAAMNARDFAALDSLVAADVVRHSPSTPGLEIRSLEQFKEFLRRDFEGVPDALQEIRLMVAEGDLVAVWANYSGTQTGQMGPFPPTGERFDLDFAGILRLEDGRIVEIWAVWDNLGMLVELGHLEPPGSQ